VAEESLSLSLSLSLSEIGSHYVDQASLGLTILLPLPLCAGITGMCLHVQLAEEFFLWG
jgi:hypothetical protein